MVAMARIQAMQCNYGRITTVVGIILKQSLSMADVNISTCLTISKESYKGKRHAGSSVQR